MNKFTTLEVKQGLQKRKKKKKKSTVFTTQLTYNSDGASPRKEPYGCKITVKPKVQTLVLDQYTETVKNFF